MKHFVVNGITSGSAVVVEVGNDGKVIISTSNVNHVSGKYYRVSIGADQDAIAKLAELFTRLAEGVTEYVGAPVQEEPPKSSITGLRISPPQNNPTASGQLVYSFDDRASVAIVHTALCVHSVDLVACDAVVLVGMARSIGRSLAFCTECEPMGSDTSLLNRHFDNVNPARLVSADAWALFQSAASRRQSELYTRSAVLQ